MEIFGIDVSKWNGSIAWSKVAKNKSFAILKATQKNNSIETSFYENYTNAIKQGIDLGVYRYVYAKNLAEAREEANALVKILNGKTIQCGVWLDMEDSSIKNIGKANLTSIINQEAYILEQAGFGVGIYCNKDWYQNVLDHEYLKTKYPFWIARYPAADNGAYISTSKLAPKDYAVCWQYSSKGSVDGIKGNVDLNVAYTDLKTLFNQNNKIYYPKYTGASISIIEALRDVGELDTTLSNRKRIGVLNGIAGVGTLNGNCQMLNLLKQGKLKRV